MVTTSRARASKLPKATRKLWYAIPPFTCFLVAVTASCLLTAAGGMLDAWVYLAHEHVFANAQTGNVVLFAISLMAVASLVLAAILISRRAPDPLPQHDAGL